MTKGIAITLFLATIFLVDQFARDGGDLDRIAAARPGRDIAASATKGEGGSDRIVAASITDGSSAPTARASDDPSLWNIVQENDGESDVLLEEYLPTGHRRLGLHRPQRHRPTVLLSGSTPEGALSRDRLGIEE